MFTDDKWEKWQCWAELIKKDVSGTVTDHAVFTTFLRTVMSDADWLNENGAGYFSNFVARMYLARASLAVRRHVKKDRGSLMCLLKEMEAVAHEVTFAIYLEKFPDDEPPWQAGAFSRASDDGVTLSQTRVAADIAALKSACEKIETFADRTLAHADPRGSPVQFTWADLSAAVDTVHEIALGYLRVVNGHGYSSFAAVKQFDWTRGLRAPLQRPPKPEEPSE